MNNAVNNRRGMLASFVVRESEECRVDRNLQLCSSMTWQKCFFSKGRRLGHSSMKKIEVITQLQVQLWYNQVLPVQMWETEGWLTANLWDTATGPRSLGCVRNATSTPSPPGHCCRYSQRHWGCSGNCSMAQSCLHLPAGLNSCSPPISARTLKISRLLL